MGEINRGEFRRLEKHFEAGRYTEKKCASVISKRSQGFSGVEAVVQHDTAPDGEQRGHEYREPAGVIHGRVNLNPISGQQLPRENRGKGVQCDLPVRDHHALRPPGGAAGIEQAENIFGSRPRGKRIQMNSLYGFGIAQRIRTIVRRIKADGVFEG